MRQRYCGQISTQWGGGKQGGSRGWNLHVEALLHLVVGRHDGVERGDRSEHEVPPPSCEPAAAAGRGGLRSGHGREKRRAEAVGAEDWRSGERGIRRSGRDRGERAGGGVSAASRARRSWWQAVLGYPAQHKKRPGTCSVALNSTHCLRPNVILGLHFF